jgi:hypothetical protein
MKKAPHQIIGYIKNPETWDRTAFETAIRNEVETVKGKLSSSEELLVGMLVMSTQTLMDAQVAILDAGYIQQFNAGPAISPHLKVRTESLDKIVKIIKELDILAKKPKQVSEVDELFANA